MKTQLSVWTWTWTLDLDLGFVKMKVVQLQEKTVVSYHSPSEHVNQSTNQELFQIQKVTNKNARPIQNSVSANRSNHAKQRYEDMK